MATSTNGRESKPGLRNFESPGRHLSKSAASGAMCLGLAAALIAGAFFASPTGRAQQSCLNQTKPPCPSIEAKINLVFIIDRSGSMVNCINPLSDKTTSPGRGQAYNVEIEGVRQALLDLKAIPRNGSIAVAVVLFSGSTFVPVLLTQIDTDDDAQAVAAAVENLNCPNLDSQLDPCPSGETNFDAAIRTANEIVKTNAIVVNGNVIPRNGARHVLIMSTDGEPTDPDMGVSASNLARADANTELDVILIGLNPEVTSRDKDGLSELERNRRKMENIVFPLPSTDLPGKTHIIDRSDCNQPCTEIDETKFDDICGNQVKEFVDFTRRVLRSNITPLNLTVTTADDTEPNTALLSGQPTSLRQAIELANRNGGSTTITFDSSLEGKIIRPRVPLPALTAPNIIICGNKQNCNSAMAGKPQCEPLITPITIDGSQTDTTKGEQHCNGILIRSNCDVMSGLRIINFPQAGVSIEPVCPTDNVGFNRVERNLFENNVKAGVCVLDPPSGQPNAVVHNIGNTISMNSISGSKTPIDLACDGVTPNVDGDLDEGPNRLINFPEPFNVQVSGNMVTISGKAAANARIELFAVNKFRAEQGNAVVDAITCFKSVTTTATGSFSITDLSTSPCDGYAATVTDSEGNTSEMTPNCAGPAIAKLDKLSIKFKRVDASGTPPDNPPSDEFTIENCGCSRLDLTSISIQRTGSDVDNGRIKDVQDDSQAGPGFFSIAPVIAMIAPGEHQTFRVEFKPVIPAVVTSVQESQANGLRAKEVLPDKFKSILVVKHNSSRALPKLKFTGRVTTAVKLIDPNHTSDLPKVTLTRSGSDLTVEVSVFDSNLDVNNASYELLDKRGHPLPVDRPTPDPSCRDVNDLVCAIKTRNPQLVRGQSFTLQQRFSNAGEVECVRVTVSDSETSVRIASDPKCSSTSAANSLSSVNRRGVVMFLPEIKFTSASNKSERKPHTGAVSRTLQEQRRREHRRRNRND